MTTTDKQFTDRGWTRPTVRLNPDATAALQVIQERTHESVGAIVRRLLIEEAVEHDGGFPHGTDAAAAEPQTEDRSAHDDLWGDAVW